MVRDALTITCGVLEHLEALGVAVPIDPGEVTTEEFFAFWRSLEAHAVARPDLGFAIGRAVLGQSVSAQATLQAATLGEGLATMGRYKRLSCPEDVVVDLRDGEPSVRFDWVLATGAVPPLLVDAIFTSLVGLVAKGTGGKVAPIRIELARKRKQAPLLRAHFRCPVVFGATHDRLVFARGALATPFVTANRAAYAQLVPGLEAKLVARKSFTGDVRVAIARVISAGARPAIGAIARRLETSARTVQRRLEAAHTTFQDQLDDVRRVVARRLLANTELPPIDIAFLLGFAEPNSFARAFRTWEHTSPLRWRAEHTS